MAPSDSRVGLFIDVDNILICAQNAGLPFTLSVIIDRVRQEGTLMSARAYADWTTPSLRPVLGDFRSNAIELIQLPTGAGTQKNTADIQLAVDTLEMALSQVRPNIVAIVSGDRDFVPLVQKLKRYAIRVMGIGVEGSVSSVLAEACDTFIYYDDLVPQSSTDSEPAIVPDSATAHTLMRRAVEALVRSGHQPVGATVMAMMRQLDPTFDLIRFKTTFKELANGAVAKVTLT